MTRYARANSATKKKPKHGTPWKEMKANRETSKCFKTTGVAEQLDNDSHGLNRKQTEFRKVKRKKIKTTPEDNDNEGLVDMNSKPDWMIENTSRSTEDFPKLPTCSESTCMSLLDDLKERGHNHKAIQKCFSCRQTGHRLKDCPLLSEGKKSSMCYKCGSTEHLANSCKNKTTESLPYATCFVCNKRGHIARHCPQNDHGVYIDGGECHSCGSKTHFGHECPLRSEKHKNEVVAIRREDSISADLEIEERPPNRKFKKPKIVIF